MFRLLQMWAALRSSLWFLPALMAACAVALAAALIELDTRVARELLAEWPRLLAAGAEPEHVVEVVVGEGGGAGKTLAELALRGCVVAALKRDDRLVVPTGSTRLREGDVLTLIGGESAVHAACEKLDGTS